MRKILKRFITTNPAGRALNNYTERLIDDGRGQLSVTERRIQKCCPNCRTYVTNEQIRGQCDYCRRIRCCEMCAVRCQCCSRLLCGRCRRGFIGQRLITVCPVCLTRLRQRQAFYDQQLMRKFILQKQIMRQREQSRLYALHLQTARIRMMGQLQMTRIQLQRQIATAREHQRLKIALARIINHARRSL